MPPSTGIPFQLHTDAWGDLILTDAEGRTFQGVGLVRAFPISHPQGAVSVCDAHGHELLWIDDLAALPAELRRTVEESLARREFLPQIRRLSRVSRNVEPSEWDVETDRGPTSFQVNSEGDVRSLDGRRALVTDAHGLRYLIADVHALDAHSRRLLERFL